MKPRTMKTSRLTLALVLALAALTRSDGQQAQSIAEQLKLAGVVPGGALLYIQARDLASLMRTWLSSPVRDQFYKSASFTDFSRSRIYLRLQDRKKEFETALGFGLDENRMAELAGGATGLAIYDIGKFEIVFVTEVRRERAIATVLFKNAAQFQERSSEGFPYYVREVATDGGRLNQQFCFAYSEGKLIVTTAEGLMIRSLKNFKEGSADSLITSVTSLADSADGFSAHQVIMWLDQARLNQNRHFAANWIHGNPAGRARTSLGKLEAGIVDLSITREGMIERRWFKVAPPQADGSPLAAIDSTALLRFAPPETQLIQVHPADVDLSNSMSLALAGRHFETYPVQPGIPDRTRSRGYADSQENNSVERYGRLDARFDQDVDEEMSTPKEDSSARSGSSFEDRLSSILATTSPIGYAELARSRAVTGKPFVRFDRAVVVRMQREAALDRATFEQAITEELRTRFVVKGVDTNLEWREAGGARYVAQSLLERSPSYAVSGQHLIVASSREFLSEILRTAGPVAPAGSTSNLLKLEEPLEFYAIVRVANTKPVFDKLMSKLDGRSQTASQADASDEREVKFFSENLSSLIAVSGIREVRIGRQKKNDMLMERLVYNW